MFRFSLIGLIVCVFAFSAVLLAEDSKVSLVSLLDPVVMDCDERELLEMKVASARKLADYVDAARRNGHPGGSILRYAEVRAKLAAAEIELYRHIGDRDKLQVALEANVGALTDKLRAMIAAQALGTEKLENLYEAEIQLLDAILEAKHFRVASKHSGGPEKKRARAVKEPGKRASEPGKQTSEPGKQTSEPGTLVPGSAHQTISYIA